MKTLQDTKGVYMKFDDLTPEQQEEIFSFLRDHDQFDEAWDSMYENALEQEAHERWMEEQAHCDYMAEKQAEMNNEIALFGCRF